MSVIFPDIEKIIIAYLNTRFASIGSELSTGVRVAVSKTPPDEVQPSKEIVITAAYANEVNFVTKNASVTIEVYASDYSVASDLALLVEAVIRDVVGDHVKAAEVSIGPTRIIEKGTQEKRYLDVSLVVKGTDL